MANINVDAENDEVESGENIARDDNVGVIKRKNEQEVQNVSLFIMINYIYKI